MISNMVCVCVVLPFFTIAVEITIVIAITNFLVFAIFIAITNFLAIAIFIVIAFFLCLLFWFVFFAFVGNIFQMEIVFHIVINEQTTRSLKK